MGNDTAGTQQREYQAQMCASPSGIADGNEGVRPMTDEPKPVPLCDDCVYWRDYRDDMDDHPDYDGHCWVKGIMTLNVKECKEHDKYLEEILGWKKKN